jgi:hypothetical protein
MVVDHIYTSRCRDVTIDTAQYNVNTATPMPRKALKTVKAVRQSDKSLKFWVEILLFERKYNRDVTYGQIVRQFLP